MKKEVYKALRLAVTGEKDEAIKLLEIAAKSMGGLGQCECCCGINPHSSSDVGFGCFSGLDVEPDLRFHPEEIGHRVDCDLAITLEALGSQVVYQGSFTESDRIELLKER